LDDMPPRPAPASVAESLTLAYRWPNWPKFTHSFFRVLYPKRFSLFSAHVNLTG
jgi:hypothetical protein